MECITKRRHSSSETEFQEGNDSSCEQSYIDRARKEKPLENIISGAEAWTEKSNLEFKRR